MPATVSRKRFLELIGGGAGTASALAVFAGGCGDEGAGRARRPLGSPATGADDGRARTSTAGDLGILNYALTFEHLEAELYQRAAVSGLFRGDRLEMIKRFARDEQRHVELLRGTVTRLGGAPAGRPRARFPLDDPTALIKVAQRLENLGAAAYLGQVDRIRSGEVLAAVLSIHSVEARHAAALNAVLGKSVTPTGAFARGASMEEALRVARLFIVP